MCQLLSKHNVLGDECIGAEPWRKAQIDYYPAINPVCLLAGHERRDITPRLKQGLVKGADYGSQLYFLVDIISNILRIICSRRVVLDELIV